MKLFSVLFALGAISLVASQFNCQNPLLASFNIAGLDAPINGSGLLYCNYLRNAYTCCSADTVAGFQARADALVQSLQSIAGQRDQETVILAASYIDQFRDAYSDLTDEKSDLDDIKDKNPTIGDEIQPQYTLFGDIKNELDKIDGDDFNEDFRDLQKKRVGCFNALLQIQASAWCLACDPNYNVGGVQSNGSVAFSQALQEVISTSCAPFVAATDKLSPVFRADQGFLRMVNITQYLKDYSDNDHNIPNYVIDGWAPIFNATEQTNTVPAGCDDKNCPWQGQNLFTPTAQLQQEIVGNGAGLIGGSDLILPPIGYVSTPQGVETLGTQVTNTTTPPPPDTTTAAPLPENTTVVAAPADTTTAAPTDDNTVVAATDDNTAVVAAPADTAVVAPTDDGAVVAVPADTTVVAPTDDNTAVVAAPADTAVVAPTDDGAVVAVPADTAVVAPTDDNTAVVANNDDNTVIVAPADNTTVVAPTDDSTVVVAPADNSTAPAPETDVAPGATWAPNLADSGLIFNVVADPAGVSGVQGGGQNSDDQPSDSDGLDVPGSRL